ALAAVLWRHCYIQYMNLVVHQPEDQKPDQPIAAPPRRAAERLHRHQDGAPVVLQLAAEELGRPGMTEGGPLDHHHVLEIVGPHAADLQPGARPHRHLRAPFPRPCWLLRRADRARGRWRACATRRAARSTA